VGGLCQRWCADFAAGTVVDDAVLLRAAIDSDAGPRCRRFYHIGLILLPMGVSFRRGFVTGINRYTINLDRCHQHFFTNRLFY
jgi:hypothetical protein